MTWQQARILLVGIIVLDAAAAVTAFVFVLGGGKW